MDPIFRGNAMAMAAPDDELPRGITRFWSEDGRVTGAGFLIAERTLCTCAHVVATALGTDESATTPPTAPVSVDFPLLNPPSARRPATVTHWRPVSGDGGGDIALLTLEETVPGTTPVRFAGGTGVWGHPFRVLGFPLRTDDHGVWVRGRLRAPVGKGWTSMETGPASPVIGRGFSGSPVWDLVQGGVVGMTVAAEVGAGATTAYLIPTALLLGLEPGLWGSPFRGLEPFREQDAHVFFARRADSERIAAAVLVHPFVPVAGASGVGKSSLVRAGVLPLLRAAGHTVTDFAGQPDTDPVRTLAAALAAQFPAARDLARELGAGTETAVLLGAQILDHAGAAGHVVLLDQFEETVGARPADARALLDVLLPMTRARHPAGRRFHVLATLRSASLEELVTDGRAEALSGTVQMVAPMRPDQLDEVVRRPVADIPGVEFEPGLPELIVADAGAEPGALPLVEFALAELWERQEHGRLTHAAYREIGGVEGALSRSADQQLAQVCQAPGGPDETVARRLFERLARPVKGKEYARVSRAFEQLSPELRSTAQALAATRLLVIARDSSGRETVALAHEALVRQWPTLRGWLDESREFLAWQEKVRGRLREWEESGRNDDLLLRRAEVVAARARAAERPAEVTGSEREFIALSRRHWLRVLRRGRTAVALVACLATLAAASGLVALELVMGGRKSDRQDAARTLAGYAESRTAKDPVAAALLALSARRTSDVPEARRAVVRTTLPLSRLVGVRRVFPEGEVKYAAASADGRTLAVLHRGGSGTMRLAVLRLGTDGGLSEVGKCPREVWGQADTVAVSDDGSKVAVSGLDGWVKVWRTGHEEPVSWYWRPRLGGWDTSRLDFSAGGALVLYGAGPGVQACRSEEADRWWYIRDLRSGTRRRVPDQFFRAGECVSGVALPPAGRDDRLSAVTSTDRGTSDDPNPVYHFTEGDLSSSRDWIPARSAQLTGAVLAAGGRMTARLPARGGPWFFGAPGTQGRQSPEEFDDTWSVLDTSGRFLVMDEADVRGTLGMVVGNEDRDAMPLVVEDSRTGAQYSTLVPLGVGAEHMTVLPRPGRQPPLVFVAQGRDVLAFSTARAAHSIADRSAQVESVAFTSAGEHLVEIVNRGAAGDAEATYSLVGRENGRRKERPLHEDEDIPKIVAGNDGHHVVVWGTNWWQLRTAPDLGYVAGEGSPTQYQGLVLVRTSEMTRVEPLGQEDFLLVDRSGVSRVYGDGGKKISLSRLHCPADDTDTNPRACVAARQPRRDKDEIVVVRRSGEMELWNLKGGRQGENAKPVQLAADWTGSDLVFTDDGSVAAISTEAGVRLWWPGTDRSERLGTGTRVYGPFSEDGRRLVVARRTQIGTETQQSLELWDTKRGELVAPLHLWSPWRRLRVGAGTVSAESQLGRVTLSLEPPRNGPGSLCGVLAHYPVAGDVGHLLRSDEPVPAAADTRPPCRDHP
ncbi:nSTAND1 domain-containing NTPase [Streptomyces diastatochromogenes]|uniref:nSTAND1 domain-containing NTPase n=1 Tax=Streptomyces diastatochromogenes TaxID=42236 RepID=UPI003686E258